MDDEAYRAVLARVASEKAGKQFKPENFLTQTENDYIVFEGDLPYPFKERVILSMAASLLLPEEMGSMCGKILKEIFFESDRIARDFRESKQRLIKRAGDRIKINKIIPLYYKSRPDCEMISECHFSYLNNMFVRRTNRMLLSGDGKDILDFASRNLKLDTPAEEIKIDPVILKFLSKSSKLDRKRLFSFLKKNPSPPTKKSVLKDAWSAKILQREANVSICDSISQLSIYDGRISGIVKLGDKVTWSEGQIILTRDLPENIRINLLSEKHVGTKVRNLIDSEYIPENLKIIGIYISKSGRVHIETDILFKTCPNNFS